MRRANRVVAHGVAVFACLVAAWSGNASADARNAGDNLAPLIQAVVAHARKGDIAAIDKALAPLAPVMRTNTESEQLDDMLNAIVLQNDDMFEWFVGSRHFSQLPQKRKRLLLRYTLDASEDIWQQAREIDHTEDAVARFYESARKERKSRALILEKGLLTGVDLEASDGDSCQLTAAVLAFSMGADISGCRLLDLAAFFGNPDAIRVLLAHGAQPDRNAAITELDDTPLELALSSRLLIAMKENGRVTVDAHDQAEAVFALLDAGADVNRKSLSGFTPLLIAADRLFKGGIGEPFQPQNPFGSKQWAMGVFDRLLAKGARPDAVADIAGSILQIVVSNGFVEAIPKFKDVVPETVPFRTGSEIAGKQPEMVDTLLWARCIAAEKGYARTFEALHDASFNPQAVCPGGPWTLEEIAKEKPEYFQSAFFRLTGATKSAH